MKNTSRKAREEESAIVKALVARGYRARRQPGSGNRAIDLQHDVLWHDSPAGKLHIEDKYRAKSLWKSLEKWRGGADILTLREAGGQRMAFLPLDLLLGLVGPADEQYGVRVALPNGSETVAPESPKARIGGSPIPSRPFPKQRRPFRRGG